MNKELFARVVDCIAATTRYPTNLLTVDADLENDLGIDSVKRVEIVAALEEEFGLELQAQERDPAIRTIGNVTSWIGRLVNQDGLHPAKSQELDRPSPPTNGRDHTDTNRNGWQSSASENTEHHIPTTGGYDRVDSTRHDLSPRASQNFTPQAPHTTGRYRHDTNRIAALQPPTHPLLRTNTTSPLPTNTPPPLHGRVALVTGSGRGIGRTIARVLAARGAMVIVNSFHSREQGEQTTSEIISQGGTAIHLWGSVANPEHVDDIFRQIDQQIGHLDILVCNASDGRIGPFLDLTWDDWDRAFKTNVAGHYQCAIRAARLMQPRGGGAIITLSAVGAHQYIDGLGSQGVVKAAVETLTRYLACELGRFGIRANCVAGGPVYGDLISKFPAAQATQNHWESITPDGELCSPMDLAQTIAFLVSDEARGINGAVWMVDHGFSAGADGRPLQRFAREQVRASSFTTTGF